MTDHTQKPAEVSKSAVNAVVRLGAAFTRMTATITKACIELEKLATMYPKEKLDKAARLAKCTPKDILYWIQFSDEELDKYIELHRA
jgi:hypothetical protein